MNGRDIFKKSLQVRKKPPPHQLVKVSFCSAQGICVLLMLLLLLLFWGGCKALLAKSFDGYCTAEVPCVIVTWYLSCFQFQLRLSYR